MISVTHTEDRILRMMITFHLDWALHKELTISRLNHSQQRIHTSRVLAIIRDTAGERSLNMLMKDYHTHQNHTQNQTQAILNHTQAERNPIIQKVDIKPDINLIQKIKPRRKVGITILELRKYPILFTQKYRWVSWGRHAHRGLPDLTD